MNLNKCQSVSNPEEPHLYVVKDVDDSEPALVKDFQSVSNNFKPKNFKRKENFGKVSKKYLNKVQSVSNPEKPHLYVDKDVGDSEPALVKDFQSVSNNFKPKKFKRKETLEKFLKIFKHVYI